MIRTQVSCVSVETLAVRDLVWTQHSGFQAIEWMNATTIKTNADTAPIRFDTGTFGNDVRLSVSPNHRIYCSGQQAQFLFGCDDVLIEAKHFIGQAGVDVTAPETVTYYHFMFDSHQSFSWMAL